MADKPVDIHPAALEDFKSAVIWYLERSETAAAKFVDELDRALDLIAESPQRWPRGELGSRKFVLNRFPFAVVFREKLTQVEVLAIAHGYRSPNYWKRRL